jgi:hypothetical protein
MIPRKADEIALDEILQNSLTNKQSTNYRKILKAVFDQKNTTAEDYSFDTTNIKVLKKRLLKIIYFSMNIFVYLFNCFY